MTSEQQQILHLLTAYLRDKVQFALYFGSFATDSFGAKGITEPSDIDLAIYLGRKTDFNEQENIRHELFLIETIPFKLDVVFLDNADPIIKKQILDSGTPFVMNNREEYLKFKMYSISEYIDFKMDRKIIEDRMISRYTREKA